MTAGPTLRFARGLLALDAGGAALTAAMTGLVLAPGHIETGLPGDVLRALALTAAAFVAVDLGALGLAAARPAEARGALARGLTAIAALNLLYVGLSVLACLTHAATLTALGAAYVALEALIIAPLAAIELRLAAGLRRAA